MASENDLMTGYRGEQPTISSLRMELARTQRRLQEAEGERALAWQFLCTVLNKEIVLPYTIHPQDLDETKAACDFNLTVDWQPRDDGDKNAVLSLGGGDEQG